MMLEPNEGTRPSRLETGRRAAGEIAGDIADTDRLAIEDARSCVAPLDVDALRARAAGRPPAATTNRWLRWVAPLALAAVALVVAVATLAPTDPAVDPSYIGVRGGDRLRLLTLGPGAVLQPWGGAALGEGDVVGVAVRPLDARGVVVLSVDGTGAVTTFWPEAGDVPEPLPAPTADGLAALPGTVVLDGAPGPEVFVAVFDRAPAAVAGEARRAWEAGGADGVRKWADGMGDAGDAIVVERR